MFTTKWPAAVSAEPDWSTRNRAKARRLGEAWSQYVGRVPWEWFVTLTFDPSVVFAVNARLADREAFWWCGTVARLQRRPVAWLYAPERGRSGRWHVHVLLVGTSGNLEAAVAMWRERNGQIDMKAVARSPGSLVLYTTKDAALSGEVVWSDTLARYRDQLTLEPIVALYPGPIGCGSICSLISVPKNR